MREVQVRPGPSSRSKSILVWCPLVGLNFPTTVRTVCTVYFGVCVCGESMIRSSVQFICTYLSKLGKYICRYILRYVVFWLVPNEQTTAAFQLSNSISIYSQQDIYMYMYIYI